MAVVRAVKTTRVSWRAPSAVAVVALLPLLLLGALASPPAAGAAAPAAGGGGLDVSTLQYEPANDSGSAFWMWVNVSNGGTSEVVNVSATISGVQVLTPPSAAVNSNFTLGRGASQSVPFEVRPGASISAAARVTSRSPVATIRATVAAPGGTSFNGGTGRSSSVSVAQADVETGGAGTWTASCAQVTGLTAATCNLAVSTSYATAEATQSVDNISAGASHAFEWMVRSDTPPDPPASAVIVVTATVTTEGGGDEQQVFTAALGKPVQTGAGGPEAGSLPPLDPALALVVAAIWVLVPLAAYMRLRDFRALPSVGPTSGAAEGGAAPGRAGAPPWSLGRQMLRKVPEITVYFWVIKVLCTTVGETAADQLNGTSLGNPMALGLSGTNLLMVGFLALALIFQFTYRKYIPAVYWVAVVLISVVGTLITDHLHDDLGVTLEVLTVVFAVALALTFAVWYRSERTLSIHSIYTTRREGFYWGAILATFALGTAAGDLVLERLTAALGQVPSADDPTQMVPLNPQGALILSAGLFGAVIAFAFLGPRLFKLNAVLMFWLAYIFTRPLGANIGDILTLSPDDGGLGFDKVAVNLVFFAAIVGSVAYLTITKKDVFKGEATSPLGATGARAARGASTAPEE